MKILITGINGFIGKNLKLKVIEEGINFLALKRNSNLDKNKKKILDCDIVIHLAGINRTKRKNDFDKINFLYTKKISNFFLRNKKKIHFIYASSTQAATNNLYGKSKKKAENFLKYFAKKNQSMVSIYRMPGIFGKWCKPNYNSFIATACHNIINNKTLKIFEGNKKLELIHIDDLINHILKNVKKKFYENNIYYPDFKNIVYKKSINSIIDKLKKFNNYKNDLKIEEVGLKFNRALYSTFISHYNKKDFKEKLMAHNDNRGTFVEIMKTKNSGQFSYITIKPKQIRGNHYHHTKLEKFIVLKGVVKFNFKNVDTNKKFSLKVADKDHSVITTVPGWSHNIENLSSFDSILLIWANEVFDKKKIDTIRMSI